MRGSGLIIPKRKNVYNDNKPYKKVKIEDDNNKEQYIKCFENLIGAIKTESIKEYYKSSNFQKLYDELKSAK
jgi:hypothetical protein